MFASSRIGLCRFGLRPAHAAPRTQSNAHPTIATIGMGLFGAVRMGAAKARPTVWTYSNARPTQATIGMGYPMLARFGGPGARGRRVVVRKRPLAVATTGAWMPPAQAQDVPVAAPWASITPAFADVRMRTATAQALLYASSAGWGQTHALDAQRALPWAGQHGATIVSVHTQAAARRAGAAGRFGMARFGIAPIVYAPQRSVQLIRPTALQTEQHLRWVATHRNDAAGRLPWGQYATHAQTPQRMPWLHLRRADAAERAPWLTYAAHLQAPGRMPWGRNRPSNLPIRMPSGARRPLDSGWAVVISPGVPGPQGDEPIIIPILRAYIMLHDISVTRVSDGIAIPVRGLQLALDVDTPSWTFSATLLGPDAVDAVRADASGNPVILQAAIDGNVWLLVVEDWSEDRSFGQRAVQCRGRGTSALLSQPYQLPTSGSTTSDMTMQQVLNAHLPIGSGWTIVWATGTPDWLVPAGAWSWADQSPLAAMQAAASGAGLVLLPDTLAQTLTVQQRYPVLPWAFDAATPLITVPDAAITALQRRNAPPSQANAAMVSGGNIGGVLARVYRSGSAGDMALAQVQHPLITHTDAARLLGARLLAGQHQQPDVRSITMPLGGAIALGTPGKLLQATIGGAVTRGIVNAVQVSAATNQRTVTVRQTLTLGEDTPNVWAGFARLVPKDALRIATVQAAFADGTASIQYPGGGTQRVRNPAGIAAGSTVYVRGDKIDGPAPAMTPIDITV